MVVCEVSIVPLGTATPSLSSYVASCVKVLAEAGNIRYQLTPMGTILEGELDEVLAVIRKMHDQPFLQGAQRVLTTIKIDDRRDKEITMAGKVAAVEERLAGGR